MSQIIKKAEELSNMILDSIEYKEYISARDKLTENEEIYNRILVFRKDQLADRLNYLNYGTLTEFGREKYMSKQYSDLFLIDIVREFFEKEKNLLDLYEQVHDIMEKSFDIDLFELDSV